MIETTHIADSGGVFKVSLDLFDGPIDLLLHLVKKNELPIEKLSLGKVAEQYLACLNQLRQYDVEVAGEYLVIASTLLSVKSKYILRQDVPDSEIPDMDQSEDPHDLLLRRLREAAIYKEGTDALATASILGLDVFASPAVKAVHSAAPAPLAPHDVHKLGKAFLSMLKAKGEDVTPYLVSVDTVSISDRMVHMLEVLTERRTTTGSSSVVFEELVWIVAGRRNNLGVLVSCFLALLELCRRAAISVVQDAEFETIAIALPFEELIDNKEENVEAV